MWAKHFEKHLNKQYIQEQYAAIKMNELNGVMNEWQK